MVATSQFVAHQICEYCGRESIVIHPIYEKTENRGQKAERILFDYNSPILFTHGRLEPGKGLETLLETWQKLRQDFPDLHLFVAGYGSLQPLLETA